MAEPERTDIQFDDDQGEAADAWQRLPPDRDFFATPYDPPVKALVQEIRENELIVRPMFQRNQVWDDVRKSKFIESILLAIPIPNLFFAEDEDGTKVVVDGQQRLLALKDYVENRYPLKGLEVLVGLKGRRFDELTERQQRIIQNRTLRCLVISSRSDSEIRFQVFERLNQGGMPLNAQEVRHCMYRGRLNELLHELAAEPTWLTLIGAKQPSARMTDCELILRFLAVRHSLPNYAPPLKTLLNEFMRKYRNPGEAELAGLRSAFADAVRTVHAAFPEHPLRRAVLIDGKTVRDRSISRAVFDVQMVVMEGMDLDWTHNNAGAIQSAFDELCLKDDRFADAVNRATADKTRMDYRLRTWHSTLLGLGAVLPSTPRIPAV